MLDWLIVGAGIHGVHIARVLERGTRRLALLDPHERPLARWDRLTAIVGMSHLRSPIDVDLDRGQLSLHATSSGCERRLSVRGVARAARRTNDDRRSRGDAT